MKKPFILKRILKSKIFLGLIVFMFVSVGFFSFVEGADTEALLVTTSGGSTQIGGDLLVLLLEIKSIQLDGDIFEDEAFSNLKDFGVEIEAQPYGRENPFSSPNL